MEPGVDGAPLFGLQNSQASQPCSPGFVSTSFRFVIAAARARRMTLAMCLAAVEKRAQCTAATFKNSECWLHDRRQSDWWSEQQGELSDYAPKGGGADGADGKLNKARSGGLLSSQLGSTLVIRLAADLDRCK